MKKMGGWEPIPPESFVELCRWREDTESKRVRVIEEGRDPVVWTARLDFLDGRIDTVLTWYSLVWDGLFIAFLGSLGAGLVTNFPLPSIPLLVLSAVLFGVSVRISTVIGSMKRIARQSGFSRKERVY